MSNDVLAAGVLDRAGTRPPIMDQALPTLSTVLLFGGTAGLDTVPESVLERNGYRVIVFETLAEGLPEVARADVGVVLVDFSLTGDSGLDLCRRLKADPRTSEVPAVGARVDPGGRRILTNGRGRAPPPVPCAPLYRVSRGPGSA